MKFDVEISGLKCDNPSCDYVDPTIHVEDYEKYVNAPCPKCGANLLTEQDYQIVQKMLKLQKLFSKIPFGNKGKTQKYRVELNGTGQMDFQQLEEEESKKHL